MRRYWLGLCDLPGHARFVAAVLFSVLLLALILVAVHAWQWYAENDQRLRYADPRYSRLAGLEQSVEPLRAAAERASQQLAALTYPASVDLPSARATAQQQLRRVLEEAGMQVSGSQLLAPVAHDGFQELRLELKVTGPMVALERALFALQQARPAVLLRSLELAPKRDRRQDDNRDVIFSLAVSVVKLR